MMKGHRFGVYCVALLLVLSLVVDATEQRRRRYRRHEEDDDYYEPRDHYPHFRSSRADSVSSSSSSSSSGSVGAPPAANTDIVKSIYNILAKKRDDNEEQTTMVIARRAQAEQEKDELNRKAQELQDRAAMLARLQFCLEQDAQSKLLNASATNQTNSNDTAPISRKELEQIKEQLAKTRAELEKKSGLLDQREKELNQKEAMLDRMSNSETVQAKNLEKQKLELLKIRAQIEQMNQHPICPGTCEYNNDCSSCTNNPKCGWCRSSQTCIDSTAVHTVNCSAADFSYLYCRHQTCDQHTTCRSCMADPDCGFCVSTGKCMSGAVTGPSSGKCDSWSFASKLRFVSLNVYGRDLSNTTGRAANIIQLLKQSNADFIALQEVEDWFLEILAQDPWSKDYHASDFSSGHAPGGLLLLSKIPLASVAYQEKTQPGQVEVDQRARVMTVQPKLGYGKFVIATTHLDWRTAESRSDSLDFLFSALHRHTDVVLLGDFNFDSGAQPETDHLSKKYKDVWETLRTTQTGFTWDPATNSYARSADPNSRPSRIDRMLVKTEYWLPSSIDKIGGSMFSPHYGLMSDMQLFGAYC